MGQRIHKVIAGYLSFCSRHLALSLLVIAFLTSFAVFFASKLSLKSDLKELLPDNYRSVIELNRMLERIGGVGSLIVTVESPDVDANKRFMDDLAAKLNQLPPGSIRYMDYKSDEVRDFYEKNFLFYLDQEDLRKLYSTVKRRIDYEKMKHSPLFVEFDEEDPLKNEIEDIKNRNQKNYSSPISTVDNYYGGEWGRMLIMIIRPYGGTLSVQNARKLITDVEATANSLGPRGYNPAMTIGTCGNVKSTVEEYDTLKKDIVSTAALCISLVCLSIILYFLRLRIVFLLSLTLGVALAWTFAFTEGFIGYLNSQTAFLGSIIIGTGINYGIIVMARYVEERKKGLAPLFAMQRATEYTMSATFLAATTTAVSFAILLTAKIKGLSQFGLIGAVGVMLCWVETFLVLPVFTLATERVNNMIRAKDRPKRRSAVFALITKWVVHEPKKVLTFSTIVLIGMMLLIVEFVPRSIEYDFTKLRNKTSVTSGTEALEKRVSKFFKHSMTPAVVMLDSMEDAPKVCAAVNSKNMLLPEADRRVGSCYSIYDLLPKMVEAKLPIIEDLKQLLIDNEKWMEKLDPELREKIEKIKSAVMSGRTLTLSDIPDTLKKHFQDLMGNSGVVVFINPRPGMLLSDGRNLIRFADTIREIVLPDGRVFYASGESIIFSDLVKAIKKEGPLLTLASFICVLMFVYIVARKYRASLTITTTLVAGIIGMLGFTALFDIKLNFFNFIALPLTFGIGVDYAINIALRLRRDRLEGVEHALRHTGSAVVLCSITTIIGYFVLIIANNQALASFGKIAIIGEVTCITAAIVLVPAIMIAARDRHLKKKAGVERLMPKEPDLETTLVEQHD